MMMEFDGTKQRNARGRRDIASTGGSRICQGAGGGEADHGERVEREHITGVEAELPAGSRGRDGRSTPSEAESFSSTSIQKGAKSLVFK